MSYVKHDFCDESMSVQKLERDFCIFLWHAAAMPMSYDLPFYVMSCMTSVRVDACSIARAGLYGYFTAMPKNNAMRNDRAETLSEITTLFSSRRRHEFFRSLWTRDLITSSTRDRLTRIFKQDSHQLMLWLKDDANASSGLSNKNLSDTAVLCFLQICHQTAISDKLQKGQKQAKSGYRSRRGFWT